MRSIILKVDITCGKVLVNNLEELWQQHNANSGLKEPTQYINPALQATVAEKKIYKHLYQRIKQFNANRYHHWSDEDLYQLAEQIWVQRGSYQQAASKLGRSKGACKQMMHRMRQAGVLTSSR